MSLKTCGSETEFHHSRGANMYAFPDRRGSVPGHLSTWAPGPRHLCFWTILVSSPGNQSPHGGHASLVGCYDGGLPNKPHPPGIQPRATRTRTCRRRGRPGPRRTVPAAAGEDVQAGQLLQQPGNQARDVHQTPSSDTRWMPQKGAGVSWASL